MSDNHKNTLKTAWNDVTGDFIKTGKGSQEKYSENFEGIFGKKEPKKPWVYVAPASALKDVTLIRCASNRDGECHHKQCPQLRDNEPQASGRSCPLPD